MTLLDRKMHFLGNYHHDFPRLAKQSGFFFQLHRGKVNWSEIENLNLDDIKEDRNFELLERNLSNVINCDLERDYDLKILDQNFVKLFKVAQLGIDYLSYCELYLDRCVVLLQEQLIAIQEELETLKNEKEGKDAELKKIKSKKKRNNYQCDKCEKVFISEVYLQFHDKRRHSNLTTPKSDEGLKKLTDAYQQTENGGKSSVSVQTFLEEGKNVEIRKMKKGHSKKSKRLEKNLNELSGRLQKAEKALEDMREANKDGFSFPFVYYHPQLQFMPPCYPPSRDVNEIIQEKQKSLPRSSSPVFLEVDVEDKNSDIKKSFRSTPKYDAGDGVKNNDGIKIDLVNNKENADPEKVTSVTKPLPPPRKTKKRFQNILSTHQNSTASIVSNQQSKSGSTTNTSVSIRSVVHSPVSAKGNSEPNLGNLEEIEEGFERVKEAAETNSDENLNLSRKRPEESKSFFKKVVASSPKLRKLRKNLKKPLTNFYDSVSSTGKDFMKFENKLQSTKNVLVDGLNNQLRGLGIDPEWKGIPKKTMKQKLKHLTHRRKLRSEEDPLYTSIRKNAEEKIFEKLKKNFFPRKSLLKHSYSEPEMEEEIHPADENSPVKSEQPQNDRNHAILYDTDTESEKSPLELNEEKQSPVDCDVCDVPRVQIISDSDSEEEMAGEKKFDISMFQIKKGNEKSGRIVDEAGELLTNSDFEDEFLTHSDNFFKPITVHIDARNSFQ